MKPPPLPPVTDSVVNAAERISCVSKWHGWLGNPGYDFTGKTPIQEIDKILQQERIEKDGSKVIYHTNPHHPPKGTFILLEDQPYLVCNRQMHLWTPFGYEAVRPLQPVDMVSVLTPKSVVDTFHAGNAPQIEASHNKEQLAEP